MAVATGRHAASSPPDDLVHEISRSKDAPPNYIKIGERNMEYSKGAGGSSLTIGNLPTGTDYKQLLTHARSCGTAPAWAVVYGANDGVVAFVTKHAATNALDALSGGPLFRGRRLTCSKNIDQRSRHSARSCRYGARCRGRNTY